LLSSPYRVRSLLVTPARLADFPALSGGDADVPVYVAEQAVMNRITGFDIHRGALAAGERRSGPDLASILASARHLLVVEGLTDGENVGALSRNAAAFGVDAVLLCPRCCDPLYRRAIRVSMGQVLHMPFTRLPEWPDELAAVQRAGFVGLALTPSGEAEPIDAVAADPPAKWAVMVGSEGGGLSDAALATAARRVRIPVADGVDSLNAATAAAIALHRLSQLSW
jgi:tRNA G18 (ribose-2'-O)-methylase SpoU